LGGVGLVALALAFLSLPSTATAADGLMGYWTFEEGTGTTTADASGNNLTGTLLNGPLWVPGKTGQYALDFDGSNDRVDVGNPMLLQLTGPMTLTAWAWPDSVSDSGRIITKGGASGSRGWSLNAENTGTWAFQVAVNSTTLTSLQVAGVPLNTWTHVAGVYDPSAAGGPSMKLYTNGLLAATLTTGVPAAQYNSGVNVSIGARADGTTRWNGRLDEVRVYNRALTQAEIVALPELSTVPPQPIVFVVQPINQTVNAGDPVSFEAAVTNPPPYFAQWFSNGVAITGANQLVYSIQAATTNMNGTLYSVTVSNAAYSATSSNALLTVLPNASGLLTAGPPSPRLYRVYEIALGANAPGTLPYLNGPGVTATFTHASGTNFTVRGFWDGANIWRLRFAPTLPGTWNWVTTSTDAGLNGCASNFTATASTAAELAANPLLRGFIKRDGYAWRLSDGTRFLPVGDTQWSFAEELFPAEFEAWMDVLKTRGLNTVHGCAWLALYTRGGLNPFSGSPAGDSLNPAYFRRLDQMIQYANDQGIMVGLCIGGFPGNSAWWSMFNTQERDDRWFRYIVSRYTALNVRWVLYGEVNEANPSWGTWQSEVAHKAALVKAEDPYRHPIGSHHNSVDTSSIGNTNVDYLEVQLAARNETQYVNALDYRQYGKPVWFEEYWYESAAYDNEYILGIRNTHRSFIAALAFPTFGSLMRAHANHTDFPPTRATQLGMSLQDYLLAYDPGLQRMQHFAEFMRDLNTAAFSPASARVNRGQCGQFGNAFAIFLQGGGSVDLSLTDVAGEFKVRCLDINTGQVTSLGTVTGGGVRTIASGKTADVSILVIPAAPRLEGARVTAQNEFAFRLIGEDQRTFKVERSIDFLTWSEVGQVTTTNAEAEFREPAEDGPAQRIYRARLDF